ncbi:zinc-binding dehydrogenase [Renibacterium salmoninarum ATCC 33209]|uniref:Zinc-binding dehydrogenase n=1 Tax=Renibacterium salmoninarum (strain ATCC 33209 / DSM 20767 / JCM 11484 / NBRC 15589 / NCIMB 2235) TaxID=288705 RepID=A9WMB8_RENSM|nr:NADP-dependent oxidoreductase [Renibacterium salmoninarum]ABY22068.1 zinc-binding dehydrogenase [Renibacterium salmoninarum ATCC 33209]
MSLPVSTRQFELASRPNGVPTLENFRFTEADLPELADGQILVKNVAVSVDLYMRGRMNDVKSYVPPFQLDKPLDGGAVGEVIASRSDSVQVGDAVVHDRGWRDYLIADAARVQKIDLSLAPASAYLGVLGMTGLTAYIGLTKIAESKAGDVVFVSGAAGAVGSLVGKIAKQLGAARVIGSAGSAEKVAQLLELGFDAAFNYNDGPVKDQLKAALGDFDGIDVYFDNVGGEHLEAAIWHLNKFGRVALCGAISQYNSTEAPVGPRNFALAIGKELNFHGFIVSSYAKFAGEYAQLVGPLVASGKIQYKETVVRGIENTAQAFIDMLGGANTGKMVITVD